MRRDYAGRVDGGEPDLGCELFEALLLVQAFDVARVLVVAELDDLCGHCEPRKTENPAGISPAGQIIARDLCVSSVRTSVKMGTISSHIRT